MRGTEKGVVRVPHARNSIHAAAKNILAHHNEVISPCGR